MRSHYWTGSHGRRTAPLIATANSSSSIAANSSTQIALFVAPLLVLVSLFYTPMDLILGPMELATLFFSSAIFAYLSVDGETNWLEGVQLLALYLSRVYFGSGCYGIEAASRRFFNTSAAHLSIREAAALAAILKSPAGYSPVEHPEKSAERTRLA